jgi:hypothetical protein
MPKGWSRTQEQDGYLESWHKDYHHARATDTMKDFRASLWAGWERTWPERDALFPDLGDVPLDKNQLQVLADAQAARKKVSLRYL